MKKTFNLFPLLLCLFYSTAQASPPSQNDFDFLKPFNDSALVENGLELTESIAGLSLSTLLNLGIWWGVCKTPGIVSGLSGKYDPAASDTKELEALKTDVCLQLAPVATAAEVALAGHVSPWPMGFWWKPLYFAGAGMAAAVVSQTREFVPVAVFTYFASEAVSRTLASTTWVLMLRKMSVRDIRTEWYGAWEDAILSALSVVIAGGVAYKAMIHNGFSSTKGIILASVVSAAIAGALSGIIPGSIMDVDGQTKTGIGAADATHIAAVRARGVPGRMYAAATSAVVLAGGLAVKIIEIIETGTLAQSIDPSLSGVFALDGALVGSVAGMGAAAEAKVEPEKGVMVAASVITLSGFGVLLMLDRSKITSDNPFITAGVTLVPALTFAVINSLSNYAVYGYPLEQSLSETGWTQWKKFYAPLDYLSTLFN
ncbi:hypothetical protein [Endozoicomonas sp. 2B-B]